MILIVQHKLAVLLVQESRFHHPNNCLNKSFYPLVVLSDPEKHKLRLKDKSIQVD